MKNKRNLSSASFFNSRFTATISISLVLFLLGLIIFLSLFAGNLSNYIRENLSFDIVLSDDMKEPQILQFQKKLETTDFAKSVRYISKEEAAKQMEEELGQNPQEFLGFNPLPAVLVVNLKAQYAETDSFPAIEKHIRGLSADIKTIEYQKEQIQKVNENLVKAGFILLGIAVLLLIISFALINNTIRLMVYSKRFLIHTMKLVGANAGFIRRPFILSNIVLGIIAALIASGLLLWLLYYVAQDIQDIAGLISIETIGIVFGCILILGIAISIVSTYLAVNRYIRMNGDDMFYV